LLTCSSCGSTHRAVDAERLGRTDVEHGRKAEELSEVCKIDIPSAYSVLLGILTVKRAQAIVKERAPARPAGPVKSATSSGTTPDTSMAPDVPDTPEAPDVLDVSDTPRPQRKRRPRRSAPVVLKTGSPKRKRRGWILLPVTTVVCLSLGVAGTLVWERMKAAETAAWRPAPLHSAEIRTNGAGRVVEISGPDPTVVLAAFCRLETSGGGYDPVEIVISPDTGMRYGIVRNPETPEVPLAIAIRRQGRAQRWVAGDGTRPIPVKAAPPFPPGAATLAVDPRR
jgi:hypothetical protein